MKNLIVSLTTRQFAVPSVFHEVIGQRQTVGGITAISVAVIVFGFIWGAEFARDTGWRHWLAGLLAVDIVAGAVANFTQGTNDFYAQRSGFRWGFIAIHIHLPIIGWLMGWDMAPLCLVWVGTIACACAVNLTGNRPVMGGFCLALGLTFLPKLGIDGIQLCLSAMFFLKVTYSFAVNHYAT
ncbi:MULTISPECIES: hypothetical protein [unclassified Yoonia]|uniref:hypothetical protein n=1 Tax=unclassified Yoonia TaxID=2629118 RepID=UPI002AFDF0F6|nr:MULTISPECIES: hypothetical protein [unclassified Yoonia]